MTCLHQSEHSTPRHIQLCPSKASSAFVDVGRVLWADAYDGGMAIWLVGVAVCESNVGCAVEVFGEKRRTCYLCISKHAVIFMRQDLNSKIQDGKGELSYSEILKVLVDESREA